MPFEHFIPFFCETGGAACEISRAAAAAIQKNVRETRSGNVAQHIITAKREDCNRFPEIFSKISVKSAGGLPEGDGLWYTGENSASGGPVSLRGRGAAGGCKNPGAEDELPPRKSEGARE